MNTDQNMKQCNIKEKSEKCISGVGYEVRGDFSEGKRFFSIQFNVLIRKIRVETSRKCRPTQKYRFRGPYAACTFTSTLYFLEMSFVIQVTYVK